MKLATHTGALLGPCFDLPRELDSAAFPPSTGWGRYCAEKRLSQGQRWSLSSHPSSAASDSPRLWDGRLGHRPNDRYGLGLLASMEGSGHSAVSYLRGHNHLVCLIQDYLCSTLTLPESSYKVHFCHGTPAPETNHSHNVPRRAPTLPPTLFWA